jgi:hypothetical protein
METGALVAMLIGIAMLILPVWLAWHLLRRLRRLLAWPRTQATVRRVWRTRHQYTAIGGAKTSTKTVHASYEFRDEAGDEHTGEVVTLNKPKVGDVIEVMYAPGKPSKNDAVQGGSVGGRIITYGAVFIILGGGGIAFILAPLGLLPS